MAWQDRPYYRDGPAANNPLMWLLSGSVPLFTIFGIRVRAHASLIVVMLLVLLFGFGQGSTVEVRVQSMTILFAIILLHEFGHCFAARWMGGDADEILMTPLGGLALAMAPRNWWGTFVTVAGGPLVNVLICLVCGLGIYFLSHDVLLTPGSIGHHFHNVAHGWFQLYNYLYWIFVVSYFLLIFNLIPVYPLDGGQMLQSLLWSKMGHYRSMLLAVNIGLVGSVIMFMVGIATFGSAGGGLLLITIAIMCFVSCLQQRWATRAAGPEDESDGIDYSAAYEIDPGRKTKRRQSWSVKRAAKRAQREVKEEQLEKVKIDAILAKVSAHGMQSLTWLEKRALHKATEHVRQRDLGAGRKH
jgi:stage IV sporulation protein FB